MGAVRILPGFFLKQVCLLVAEIYYRLQTARREVVIGNLLPALGDDVVAARKAAHELYRQFAVKMLELWRFESGVAVFSWFTEGVEWQILEEAHCRGKGVLLVTPHLGNWEIGGALLAQRGYPLLVLTQAEPGEGLTELRQAARARWNIETLVIGGEGFEFIEIIKRLQAGATVALLLDRPLEAKAVEVELFGQPFRVSVAAAELARATGCALLGVTVIRQGSGYAAKILPEFQYDRQLLGNPEARRQLVQQMMRAFEPAIRQHAEQWYHFVPVWEGIKKSLPEAGNATQAIAGIQP